MIVMYYPLFVHLGLLIGSVVLFLRLKEKSAILIFLSSLLVVVPALIAHFDFLPPLAESQYPGGEIIVFEKTKLRFVLEGAIYYGQLLSALFFIIFAIKIKKH